MNTEKESFTKNQPKKKSERKLQLLKEKKRELQESIIDPEGSTKINIDLIL